MFRTQIEAEGIQKGLAQWATHSLIEAMIANFVALSMPVETSRPKMAEAWNEFTDYTNARMVMFGQAVSQLALSHETEDRETEWLKPIERLKANSDRLKEVTGFPNGMRNRPQFGPIIAKTAPEEARYNFRRMQSMLRFRDGAAVDLAICFTPRFTDLIRVGQLYLDEPPEHGEVKILRNAHRKYMRQIISGRDVELIDTRVKRT